MDAKRPRGGIANGGKNPPVALRILRVIISSALILTFWGGTAQADKRVALVVGNSRYTRITPRLANPANDANDIAKALESIGFDVILKIDAGKGEFDRGLAEFARKASGADAALFYYAGHGLQYHGKNFFLPIDIEVQDAADVEFQAVGIDSVQQAIDRSAGVKIVILDACRDNPLAKQFVTRSLNGVSGTRGLARIDRTEGFIIAYATAPDQVAQDGAGRNSPFTEALVRRIKEPGLEIGTMFRRVTSDVYEMTNGRQRPEVSISLLTDYFLIPVESDSIAWSRVRESNDAADFKKFIQKFPSSPFAREAQARIDLFERIRRENEEEARLKREREALEAEKASQEAAAKAAAEAAAARQEAARVEAAKRDAARLEAEKAEAQRKEAERLEAQKREAARLEAEKAGVQRKEAERQEAEKKEAARIANEKAEAARKDAERIAQEKGEAARREAEKAEAQRKEAERLDAEKRAAEEKAKAAALDEENRKKRVAELERQRQADICNGDLAKLKDLTTALQTAAIQNLAKESACPSIKPAIDTALKEVERGVKRACDTDRKTLAAVKNNDIGTLKGAIDHMTCDAVRTGAQQRLAKLEDEAKQKEQICADERQKLNAIDESAAQARPQYAEFQSHAACAAVRADVTGIIKKIDVRVKAAQTELTRLGCYNAPVNGQYDEATRKSVALYHTKKGSPADGDHLTDGLVVELKQQNLGLCPPEPSPPIAAKPGNVPTASSPETPAPHTEQAKREENVQPGHKPSVASGGTQEERASKPSRKHRTESAALEEVPVSKPSRHRIHVTAPQEEPASRPRSKVRPAVAESRPSPAVARAPRMPQSPAAEGGASHIGHIGGVGF